MKKIINILLIAILSIIFIGLALFVVNFAKDTFINDNTKADTVSKNKIKIRKMRINHQNLINKKILNLMNQTKILLNKLQVTTKL